MNKAIYWSVLFSLVLPLSIHSQIVKRSQLKVNWSTRVISADTMFTYKYGIVNDSTSEQRLEDLSIEVGDIGVEKGGTITNFLDPEGWSGWSSNIVGRPIDPTAKGILIWVAEDSASNLSGLMIPAESSLLPGSSVELSFQSKGLPSIKRFWARGWARPLFEHEYDSLRALGFTKEQIQKPWYEDSFQGRTIAPQLPPVPFPPLAFLDTLISYKHQAFALGWIKNQGIVTSLDAKLDNAKRQLQRGNKTPARNMLRAFINEVEALWKGEEHPYGGKQITSEAYALLKFNAEYLISRL